MALVKCSECAGAVSTKAKACPACGAPPARPGARSAGLLLVGILAILAGGLLMWGGTSLQERAAGDEAGPETVAREEDPRDSDSTGIPDCSTKLVWDKGIPELTTADQVDVCTAAMRSFDRPPSVRLLRKLLRAVAVLAATYPEQTPKDLAYQIANIIEVRGHTGDESRMASTIDTAFKIVMGSDGHVTLKDLNMELRAAGPVARTLSDDGLITFAAVIWEFNKEQDE